MGLITRFDLKQFYKKGYTHFIETGTWYGDAVQAAFNVGMTAESCELNDKFYMITKDRFEHQKEIRIYQLPSYKFLPIAHSKRKSIFWLDAHLPDLYVHNENQRPIKESIKYPLEVELELISKKENFSKSIIVIDDMRIYRNDEFENGKLSKTLFFDPINFLKRKGKHMIFYSTNDEGYLIAVPTEEDIKIEKEFSFEKLC